MLLSHLLYLKLMGFFHILAIGTGTYRVNFKAWRVKSPPGKPLMSTEHCHSFLIPASLHSQEITMRNMGTMNHLWCFPSMKNGFPYLSDQGVRFSLSCLSDSSSRSQQRQFSTHTLTRADSWSSLMWNTAVALLLIATLSTSELNPEAATSYPSLRGSITSGKIVPDTVLQHNAVAWAIMSWKVMQKVKK